MIAQIYLADILEDSPDEHHFADLNKLEAHRLLLQLPVGHLRVLVHQAQLGVLRPGNVVWMSRWANRKCESKN